MSYFIGIDVSKEKLDCACLRNKEQKKARIMECSNNDLGFKLLVEWSENTTSLSIKELSFLIEPTSIYHESLVAYLYALDATVFMANTGRVRKFAEGIGVLSKNDIIDANVLARYGLMATKLIAWKAVPKEIAELQSLINRLSTLEKELQREKNRQEKMNECHDAHPIEKQSIIKSIRRLEKEIKSFQIHIRNHVSENESIKKDFDLMVSIPGIGEKTAWIVLLILRSRNFHSASEVASYIGLNPIEKRSGKSEYRKPRLSKAGNSDWRKALYFPAMVAVRKNPDVQALYDRLLAAGKTKMCALGAAMRKLIHICFGILKHQQPYQVQLQST
jgi:transposase